MKTLTYALLLATTTGNDQVPVFDDSLLAQEGASDLFEDAPVD